MNAGICSDCFLDLNNRPHPRDQDDGETHRAVLFWTLPDVWFEGNEARAYSACRRRFFNLREALIFAGVR